MKRHDKGEHDTAPKRNLTEGLNGIDDRNPELFQVAIENLLSQRVVTDVGWDPALNSEGGEVLSPGRFRGEEGLWQTVIPETVEVGRKFRVLLGSHQGLAVFFVCLRPAIQKTQKSGSHMTHSQGHMDIA